MPIIESPEIFYSHRQVAGNLSKDKRSIESLQPSEALSKFFERVMARTTDTSFKWETPQNLDGRDVFTISAKEAVWRDSNPKIYVHESQLDGQPGLSWEFKRPRDKGKGDMFEMADFLMNVFNNYQTLQAATLFNFGSEQILVLPQNVDTRLVFSLGDGEPSEMLSGTLVVESQNRG